MEGSRPRCECQRARNFDAAGFGIDLVVEVIASAAQKKAANAFPVGVAGPRPYARLRGDELERSLKVVREGKRGCRAIGSPPRCGPPDLRRCSGGGLDEQACRQGLLAKFPEEGLRIHELALRCLLERLFERDLLFGGQLKGLVGFRYKDGDDRTLLEGVTVEFQLPVDHLARRDSHATDLSRSRFARRRTAPPNGSGFSCNEQR
jgi:hypothetical protein